MTQTEITAILEHEYNRYTLMKYFDWNDEKNEVLKKTRGVSFEQVELAIALGDLIAGKTPEFGKISEPESFSCED